MKIPTKTAILDHLKKARYMLQGVVDMSPAEGKALDELNSFISHIENIDARGYSIGE